MSSQNKTASPQVLSHPDLNKSQSASKFIDLKPDIFSGFWGELFDSLPQGVIILNHQREILYINQKMHELWGVPKDAKTGVETLEACIHKVENPTGFKNRIEAIIADLDCESQEIIKLKNGNIYQRNTKPLIISGENAGRFWTYQDITKEYRTEQALRESEKKYKELYDLAERSNQKLNLINRIRNSANDNSELPILIENLVDGLAHTFGYELAGFYVYKDDLLHLIHSIGFDGEKYYEMTLDQGIIGRAARTQKAVFIEDVTTDPAFMASTTDVMSEISAPVFDRNELYGVLNVESKCRQLTEIDLQFISALCEQVGSIISRIRLYTEVRTQEQQLQRIFDFAPIGVVICALNGTFLRANQAFEKTIGYSVDELRKMKFIDITHPEEVDNNLRWTNRLVHGEITTYGFEKRYIHKNGSIINAFLQVSILPTQSSEPDQLIAQVVDLTTLKNAERALLQRQKMESIGVLAGGIAHDFNNLLVALKAQSSLALLKLPDNSPAKNHLEKANLAADNAAKLTAQLLAYSGQGQFKVERTNLNDEVEQNSQLFAVAIPKNVQIRNQLEPDLPEIMVDKGQFQQVLMNLIINGSESMEGRPGQINISTSQAYLSSDLLNRLEFTLMPPAPGPFIEISVADDGDGMSKDTLAKIFDPFFTTKFTGRGLGLAAVLGIVRSHNGGLIVSTTPNQGTKFSIFFPIAANQETLNPPKIAEAPARQTTPTVQENPEKKINQQKVVLLIDDDDLVRETMADLFEIEDIPLLCAADGNEGINLLSQHPNQISLALLDLSMPGISSEDTFTELRRLKPDLPILLCSGFSELRVNQFFANKPYQGFIAKPFEIEELIETIHKFM